MTKNDSSGDISTITNVETELKHILGHTLTNHHVWFLTRLINKTRFIPIYAWHHLPACALQLCLLDFFH